MTKKKPTNIPASVRNRLLEFSRNQQEDFQYVLIRFALERFLYRLGQSPHRDLFTLKGALLFPLWGGERHRPTKDLDLLGQGPANVDRLEGIVRDICQISCPDDGLTFRPETVKGERRREDQLYEGLHINLWADLAGAAIPVQIDIGFGDAVTPAPIITDYPAMLALPPPHLRVYPRETVVAEKLQAMVELGMTNTRMKDFFDLRVLAQQFEFAGPILSQAIQATFQRRQTPIPAEIPLALTTQFSEDPVKEQQWQAFLSRSRLGTPGATLTEVVAALGLFLMPVIQALRNETEFQQVWPIGGPWRAPT